MNKKANGWLIGLSIVGVIFFILLMVVMFFAGTYNSLVGMDVNVENKWANVQTAYQRRADLIPNLVATVEGARDFEQETQTQIAAMRAQAGQIQQNVQNAETVGDLQQAQGEMSSLLSRLLVVVEAYPDLKATQNFQTLQDELAGTENRIKWERDQYNEAVRDYKQKVRSFPTNIIAGMYGFFADKWDMFQADEGAQNAPTVDFG